MKRTAIWAFVLGGILYTLALFAVRRRTSVASPVADMLAKPPDRVRNQLQLLAYDVQSRPRAVLCAVRALALQLDSAELSATWASLATTDTIAGHADTRPVRALIAHPPDQAKPETPCTNFELAQGLMTDDWMDRPVYGQPAPPPIDDTIRAASIALALDPQSEDLARKYVCARSRAMRQLDSTQRKTIGDALARQESRLEAARHKAFDASVRAVGADAIKDPACVPWTVAP